MALLAISVIALGCAKGSPPITDNWIGRWTGPEGTYLEIAGTRGVYQVTIKDLDAARSFAASARTGGIAFTRDGVQQIIRATNGDETGMKWLAGKKDCLTVKPGEGYCRD